EEREALGYLHANCGNCHHPRSFVSNTVDMQLWLPVDSPSVAETPTVQTTVNRLATATFFGGSGGEGGQSSIDTRVVPGQADESVLFRRMVSRQDGVGMPPVGSELVDEAGSAAAQI